MRRVPAALLLAAVLLIGTGCSTEVAGSASPAVTTSATTSSSTPSPTPPPTPVPTPVPTTAAVPAQVLDAGSVADGAGVSLAGTGPAAVTYGIGGEFAVVATLDCAGCTGEVVLTEADRGTPLASGTAPWSGQALTDVLDTGAVSGELLVLTEGDWTLTVVSWNDLPPTTGPQTVTGSAVLRLADAAPAFRFDWTPAGPGDEVSARAFSNPAPDEARVFGNTEAYSTTVETPMPGVLAVRTAGTWTVTPGG